MASRTMANLFKTNKMPVSTGVIINKKVMYLHSSGYLSLGVIGVKLTPITMLMGMLPKDRRRIRRELRAMGHHELVLATIPARQLPDRVIQVMADNGPYGRIV